MEGFDTDTHVAASAAGLQQRDASFTMKHVDDKQCSDSGLSIKPLFPFSRQKFAAEIEEHLKKKKEKDREVCVCVLNDSNQKEYELKASSAT